MLLILLVLVVKEAGVVIFRHELLWGLVDIHLSHLLLGLAGLLINSLLLFLGLLGDVDPLELIEDVLVVEQGVREFVHEGVSGEEAFDSTLEHGHLEQLVDRRSLPRVSLKHHLDDVVDGGGEVGRQGGVVALDNFLGQLMEGTSVEGRGQSCHLVEEYSEGPDVGLEAVALTLDDLRGQVVRGSHHCLSLRPSVR